MAQHTTHTEGYIAANRFGLGLRPGELTAISTDPRGWLRAQLDTASQLPAPYQQIESSPSLLIAEGQQRAARRSRMRQTSEQSRATPETNQLVAERDYQRDTLQERQRQIVLCTEVAITTEQPFAERLVRFWSNHFTVAVSGGAKAVLRTIALPYENEAIRANLNSDFKSLLLAVEQHPAMLIYLDNTLSIGPHSQIGRRRDAGLNENLAREILELHTLGVAGGYTQADVTNLAKMITGWSVPLHTDNHRIMGRIEPGHFNFMQAMHEPGAQQLLDRSYSARGVEQGEQALADLASHPATAKHIATKLARHFVADDPDPASIAVLEQVFLDTQGSLPALHAALINLEQAWEPKPRKLKTPEELIVSTARGLNLNSTQPGIKPAENGFAGALAALNHAPFSATSPAGWPDNAEHWGSPDALLKRIEWSNQIAERSAARIDPGLLYPQIMPVEPALQLAITRAESSSQGLALLLASPQFQWR